MRLLHRDQNVGRLSIDLEEKIVTDVHCENLACLAELVQGYVAARLLVQAFRSDLDLLTVLEGLDCVFVGPCRHQQLPCLHVDPCVLAVALNQLLVVRKRLLGVVHPVVALASIRVGLRDRLIELESDREIVDGFTQHLHACVGPPPHEVVKRTVVLFFADRFCDVLCALIKVVQVKVQQCLEEVKTGVIVLVLAVCDCFFNKKLRFLNFVVFDWLVDPKPMQGVSVALHNGDHLQAVAVFVAREHFPRLAKVLRRHQVILVVHSQNAFA